MNRIGYLDKIGGIYHRLGAEEALKVEASWPGVPLPASLVGLSTWVLKYGEDYYSHAFNSLYHGTAPSSKKGFNMGKLALSCLLVPQKRKDEASLVILSTLKDLTSKVDTILKKTEAAAPEEEGVTQEDIDMINGLAEHPENLKEVLSADKLELSMGASMIRAKGKTFLAAGEGEVVVPLSDDDIKRILAEEGLEKEEVEVEGVKEQASLYRFSGVPLWIHPLTEDYVWSRASILPAIRGFLTSKK